MASVRIASVFSVFSLLLVVASCQNQRVYLFLERTLRNSRSQTPTSFTGNCFLQPMTDILECPKPSVNVSPVQIHSTSRVIRTENGTRPYSMLAR
ncbi:hypothetical protein B566_EDAN005189, partial [Ephemera danica]